MISICPDCGKRWKISDDFVGRRMTCKACKQIFTITEVSATAVQRRQKIDTARSTGHATQLRSKQQSHPIRSSLNSKTMERVSPPFSTETATATSIHDAGLPSKNQDHWAGLKREQVPRSIGTSTTTISPVIEKVIAKCPHCSKRFKVNPKVLGLHAKCPVCKKPFRVSAITKAPIKVSGGGLKQNQFREAIEQPERTSKTSTRTAPHMMSDEKVSIKTKTIDTQSRTTGSNDTDRSSGLMLRPDTGLLSLMPIAEMKIKAGIAIWTMLITAMMIIVYDLWEAMGIYHAVTAIMIALAVYGGGTFVFLNRQREWITSDH